MRLKSIFVMLSSLLATPLVSAAPFDGIAEAMGMAWNAIGALFSFEFVSQSPLIREGILKFLVFILILRVVQVAVTRKGKGGKALFDNKTGGIIGFVVAAVTVIFTPNSWMFAAAIALLVPLTLIGFLVYYSMMVLKKDWLQHLMGAVLLLVTSFIVGFTIDMFSTWNSFNNPTLQDFALVILNLIQALVLILFIFKLIMIFLDREGGLFSGRGPSGQGPAGNNTPGRGPSNTGPNNTSPGNGNGRGDGTGNENAPEGKANGLDWEHPGLIRVLVTNADDNPQANVSLKIFSVDTPLWRRMVGRGSREMIVLQGKTNADGYWPSRVGAEPCGSGPIRVIAKTLTSSAKKETYVVPSDGQKVQTIKIDLRGRDVKPQRFEPRVINVEEKEDGLHLTGVIDNA